MRSNIHRFKLILLPAPITSSVPSYCCDLDSPLFCDSATICRASCPHNPPATTTRNQKPETRNVLLIFQRLNQRPPHRRLRRPNRGDKRNGQYYGHQNKTDLIRIFVVETHPGQIFV